MLFLAQSAEIFERKFEWAGRLDNLHRLAFNLGKVCAQALMAFDDSVNGPSQRLKIKPAAQPERLRHVVFRAAPFKLVNKP